ncbi:MAG: bifunctional glutamate N-acetyltransferase/amino-acid acetyltransferase ArgJ [Chloroflexi bacterium]|nr:bifunctional glutamate N-acetyltransferase/amino-acid acetyltransferase ArgJ [Chloroflexota bacterium]
MNPDPHRIDPAGLITAPAGFRAGALACGLKASGNLDLALLLADASCPSAALFTRNRVAAAPVILGRETLPEGAGRLRAVLINAGNANACTGERGLADARAMRAGAAALADCPPEEVLVLSTGVIGVPLDMAKVEAGLAGLPARIGPAGGRDLALAMMTTDTRPKQAALALDLPSGARIQLAGAAKGSGMIHPDMATMLALVTTDAQLEPTHLAACLRSAADRSFNRISVDGDTSTNDALAILASGASGHAIDPRGAAGAADLAAFEAGLTALCQHLARAIVRDGEGASRLAVVRVTGAASAAEARQVANAIATSPLVKTALAGADPNWGRIVAAAGRAGVPIDPARMALDAASGFVEVGDPGGAWLRLFEAGTPSAFGEAEAAAIFAAPELTLRLGLGLGAAEDEVWTCDLTADYVRINADYRT